MAQITGRVTISLNGEDVKSKEGATLNKGGVSREEVPNDQGGVDYMEKTTPCTMEFEVPHSADVSVEELDAFVGTAVFKTDTGKSFVCAGAFMKDAKELSGGSVKCSLAGPPAVEQ